MPKWEGLSSAGITLAKARNLEWAAETKKKKLEEDRRAEVRGQYLCFVEKIIGYQ